MRWLNREGGIRKRGEQFLCRGKTSGRIFQNWEGPHHAILSRMKGRKSFHDRIMERVTVILEGKS